MRCRECRKELHRRTGVNYKKKPPDVGASRRFAQEHSRWIAGMKGCLGYFLGTAIILGIFILIARALMSWNEVWGVIIFVFMLAIIIAFLGGMHDPNRRR